MPTCCGVIIPREDLLVVGRVGFRGADDNDKDQEECQAEKDNDDRRDQALAEAAKVELGLLHGNLRNKYMFLHLMLNSQAAHGSAMELFSRRR